MTGQAAVDSRDAQSAVIDHGGHPGTIIGTPVGGSAHGTREQQAQVVGDLNDIAGCYQLMPTPALMRRRLATAALMTVGINTRR